MAAYGRHLSRTLVAVLLISAWGALLAGESPNSKQYSLEIQRGSLLSALDQFSEQTGLEIGVSFGTPSNRELIVGPLSGDYTAGDALKLLLATSRLSFEWRGNSTVRIFASTIVTPHSDDSVNEVLVTGTRMSGGMEGPAPVRVYGSGKIERYGASTISDLTRYINQQPFSFGEGFQPSGAQHFQLRGLGFDTTLILINGRRAQPSANSISLNAFDLNGIPLTAVDHIEVMSDSASAIYGADAVGGVVNIILKDELGPPEVDLHYGSAAGGGDEQRAAVSFGIKNSRLKSAFVFDYFEHGGLLGEERDLWRDQDFTRFGGRDYRVANANPGNVYSLNGQPLPGLRSTSAGIPLNSSGVGLTPADFVATAGRPNLYSSYSARSVAPEWYRSSAYGSVQFQVDPRFDLFGEFLYGDSRVVGQRSLPVITREVVPATNPFNPFGAPVAVDYSFDGMDAISHRTDSELARIVAGARGDIRTWEWEIAGLYSEEDASSLMSNDLDRGRVQAAIRSADAATALNLFRDGPAGSDELLASLVASPQISRFSSGSSQLSAFVTGPLFERRAGTAELVVGGEWRREEVKFFESLHVVQDREVTSAFAEMKVPLLSKLSLKLALRGDHYGDIKDSVNPQYGLLWQPAKDWLIRAAYGTSFRPPSLFELYSPRREILLPVADPRRGGAVSNVSLVVGGNPELEVVTARSFTTGFVFTPSGLPGMRLGSNYWRVVMDSRVMVPPIAELLNAAERFPGRVTRFDPTDADILAGRPGALRSLDISRLNHGRLETSGVDLEMSYLLDRGLNSFQTSLTGTWVDEYISEDMSSVLPSNRVGVANATGTIPRWRVVGTITWRRPGFGTSSTLTFTPSYQDSDLTGPLDRRLPSRTLLDLQAWLELGSVLGDGSFFRGSKLTLGMLNVLDEAPDFANAGFIAGYDMSQADLTQRFAYLRLSKQFQ